MRTKRIISLILSLCIICTLIGTNIAVSAAVEIYYPDTDILSYTYITNKSAYTSSINKDVTPYSMSYLYKYSKSTNSQMTDDWSDYSAVLVKVMGYTMGDDVTDGKTYMLTPFTKTGVSIVVMIDLTSYCVLVDYTIQPTGVSLDKSNKILSPGDGFQLNATVQPTGATDKRINWTSSNTTVASVSGDGTVTAKSEGTATITAETVIGGYKSKCTVNVQKNAPSSGTKVTAQTYLSGISGVSYIRSYYYDDLTTSQSIITERALEMYDVGGLYLQNNGDWSKIIEPIRNALKKVCIAEYTNTDKYGDTEYIYYLDENSTQAKCFKIWGKTASQKVINESGLVYIECARRTDLLKKFENITFSDATYTYDKTEKNLAINGALPTDARVDYTNEKATNAGTYNATAKITCQGYEDLILNATLKINPADISVKANDKQMVKGMSIPTLDYSIVDGQLFGEDKFSGALATRADGKTVGTFDITQGTLTAGNNYKINFTKGTLTVSDKTPQTADVSAVSEKTYGDSSFTVSVTNDSVPSLGNFTFESSNTNVAEITADGVVTIKNAGETNITVKRGGNDTYAPFEKTQKLVVKKVPITVTAEAKTKKVGTADPALTYTYTGALVGTDAFTGELTRQPGEEIGKYDILQSTLTLGDNYDITYNKAVFEILDKTPQTITVADFGEKTYGDGEFAISVTPDSTSNLTSFTYASDNEAVATVSADGKITIKGVGEANITVTEAGNADYAAATVTKKLTVNKKALNIKVDDVTVTYGEEINTNITYDGFITGEDETVLTKPVAVSGYSKKPNAGEYDIVLSGAEAANYEITHTNAKLVVNKKNITVTALKVFDKAADETTAATINNSTLVFDGVIFGDDVTIDLANASASFAQMAAGDDIAVTITGLALTGTDAANYNLTNNEISTTASIKDSITAADIAAQINALAVVKDAEAITLPSVPAGYKLTVKSSDNEAVIKTDGSIAPVANDTNVVLVLEVANENDETDVADTDEITVTVPASTTVTVTVVAGENGTAAGTGDYLKNAQATVTATPNSGYSFDGWYIGETKVSTSTAYTFKAENDITLTAKFARRSSGGGGGSSVSSYTVKFETNGGSKVSSQSVSKNSTVKEPTAPTKDGFEFAGWYSDKDLKTKYDFSDKVTKSITLYAAWTEKKAETPDPTDKPSTPETKGKFTDVNDSDWFSENVKYVFENGLMSGVSENKFAPNDNLTRAMLVTILYRAAGEPEVNKSVPFADVKADSYYANAVIWAQQNGIVSGVSENEFAPDTNITREQIATIMFRYAKEKGYDVSVGENTNILSYTDAEDISEYAIDAMQYAVGSGLIKGKSETTLNPKDTATRAEIAAILQRFIEANK